MHSPGGPRQEENKARNAPACSWKIMLKGQVWFKICKNKAQKSRRDKITYLDIRSLKTKYTFCSVHDLVLTLWDGTVIKSLGRICCVTPGSIFICIRVSAVIFFQPCIGVFFRCITVTVLKFYFNASTLVVQKGNVQLAQLAVNFIHSQ